MSSAGRERFVPGVAEPESISDRAWWFAFRAGELLVEERGHVASVPCSAVPPAEGLRHYLGRLDGLDCFALALQPGSPAPGGALFSGLRPLFGRLDDDLFVLAGRAAQILEWERAHRFCGCCGNQTQPAEGERAKRCPACGHLSFPRLSPAVIVLVTRGSEMLLARGRNFAGPLYSALAGFVDPGESLEQTVVREVREEVGIEVAEIRYFGSQPWPFPHSLMIGFTARYAAGELEIDESELVDAGWFSAEALPELPHEVSIARRLIDHFLASN